MRSRGGRDKAAHRARRQRQQPARERRESKSRITPRTVQGTQDPGQSPLSGDEQRYARAMRQLRVCVRALSATLIAAATRALIDGLTVGLALALALTGVLLVAALWLRRLGSQAQANVDAASAAAARNQTSNTAPSVMPSSGSSE
jgi:cytochrome c-type biogenesis protein CcmH/NrfG